MSHTVNTVGANQTNIYTYNVFPTPGQSQSDSNQSLYFNDAPLDLLSVHFTGRHDELALIKQILDTVHGDVALRCIIYGMHGIGKTQLILQFLKLAFEHRDFFPIFWISATTVEKLYQGFAKLLDLVDHKDRSHPDQNTRIIAARRWLEEQVSVNWLLVFDNVEREAVDFLREHLPRKSRRGNILFTTRTETVANALANAAGRRHKIVELSIPGVQDAAKLLLNHLDDTDGDAEMSEAEGVVRCVGCLPLAVAQAGSYMKQSGASLEEMLDLYHSQQKIKVIEWENDLSEYEKKSVAATFTSQLANLEQQFPLLSNLMKTLSFFDPESIPVNMLVKGAESVSDPQPDEDDNSSPDLTPILTLMKSSVDLKLAILQLQNLSLLKHQRNKKESQLRIHDLIRFMVQENTRKIGPEKPFYDLAVQLVYGAFQEVNNPKLPQCWPQCEILIPHIQSLTTHEDIYSSNNRMLLLSNEYVAEYFHGCGRYSDAEKLLSQILQRREELDGPDHERTMDVVNSLAAVYTSQGIYSKAETLYERLLDFRMEQYGEEHDYTLTTMNDLADVYYWQGRFEDAETRFLSVLAIRENQLGEEHLYTRTTMINLANVYYSQWKNDEAEELYDRVLAIEKVQLGMEDPSTLTTMNNLANVYISQGRYNEAEELHGQILATHEKLFGVDHPHTLLNVMGLGIVYHKQGRYDDGVAMLQRALRSGEKSYGHAHPIMVRTMNRLEEIYRDDGRIEEAEAMKKQALLYSKSLDSKIYSMHIS